MATLRDVAQHAGVSVATASRVVTGTGPVKGATRARVERAMRELVYVPRNRETTLGAVGLLVPELANPIFPMLAQAMETRATELGFASILCNTAGSVEREAAYARMLMSRKVDAMIFISCEATDLRGKHDHYARLGEQGAKLVFVNGAAPTIDAASVSVDERAAGELATRHLIELGHKRIGFVAGPAHARPTTEKAQGRQIALAAAGLHPGSSFVAHGEWGATGGRAALRKLLSRGADRPTAVICSSDAMAIGALGEARHAGLRVPDDLSIIGFDGIEATEWTDPPLTTLAQPVPQIAQAAVDAAHALVTEPARELPHYVFRPQLLARGTAAPPGNPQ